VSSRIDGIAAEAAVATDYADGLGGSRVEEVRVDVLRQVRIGIERYYLLGQLLAMPHLATRPAPRAAARPTAPHPPRRIPGPGQKGFDVWCLSDPRIAKSLKRITWANTAINRMWAADPDPGRTLLLRADIDAALYRDDIAYDTSHYFACPWSAVYVAKRPVRIGVVTVQPLQTFTVAIDMEGRGHQFRRKVLIGSFSRAGHIRYWGRDAPSDQTS
jgi:hypothetical protein